MIRVEGPPSETVSVSAWLEDLQGMDTDATRDLPGLSDRPVGFAAPLRDICWSVDVRERCLLWLDAGAADLFALPLEDLRAKPQEMWRRLRDLDLLRLKAELVEAGDEPVGLRVRLDRGDGRFLNVLVRAMIVRDERGEPLRIDGFFRDLSEQERRDAVAVMAARGTTKRAQGRAGVSEFESAIANICRETAGVLNARRVSVWSLVNQGRQLRNVDAYENADQRLRLPDTLTAEAYPVYFQSFRYARLIDASDAWEDPRTRELADVFMRRDGFTSRLDVAIMRRREIVGVLAIEHHGDQRRWSETDKVTAMRVADTLANTWETRDREIAEQDLRLFKSIVDEANFGVLVLGLGGEIHYLNETYADMHGWTVADAVGRHFSCFHGEEQLPELDRLRRILARTGEYSGEEIWHRHRDGRVFPTMMNAKISKDARGRPLFLFATAIDITEKARQNAILREEQRKLETLVASLPGMAFRIRNEPDWPVEMVSAGSERLTGWTPEELIDNAVISHAEVVHPADRSNVWKEMEKALDRREPYEVEYRIVTRSGAVKWVWERGMGVFDHEGRLVAVEGFVIDMSDKNRAMRDWWKSAEVRP